MFNTNIFGNDDDVFDDSKSLLDSEKNESFNQNSSNKNSTKDFNKAMESVLDVLNKLIQNKNADRQDARKLVNHLREVHGIELQNFIAMFRIRLAHTVLDGSGSWIQNFQTYNIPRSVVYALDAMSENKFTIVNKFFNIELENAKRIVISRFLSDVFLSSEKNQDAINDIFGFGSGLDARYTKTYYETLYEINTFTIWQNNGVYVALGQELDLPCNQKILDCEEVSISDLTSSAYAENRFSSILTPILKQSISDNVSDYTSRYLKNVS